MKYTLIICASAVLFTFRLAITLEWIAWQFVYLLVKKLVSIVFMLSVSYAVSEGIQFYTKLLKLPGPNWRQLFMYKCVFSREMRRGTSLATFVSEYLASMSLIASSEGTDVYRATGHPLTAVFVTSLEAIKQVLHHPSAQRKGLTYLFMRFAIGDGLVTLAGEKWSIHRKLLTHAFHFRILQSIMSIVIPQADLLVARLEKEAASKDDRSIYDIIPFVLDSNVNVLCQSSMGIDTADGSNMDSIKANLSSRMGMVLECILNPLSTADYFIGFTQHAREARKFDRAMKNFVDDVIARRLLFIKENTGPATRGPESFIDIIIREHLKNPEAISLDDIREETTTFTGAGVDTTLWSISYTLLLLGHYREEQEKLYQELKEYSTDEKFSQLTTEKIKELTYLNAVYNESLRLFPPIPLLVRAVDADINVNGMIIPKGAQIGILIRNVHRDAKYWPYPHRFKPERFLTPLPEPHAFIPFSAGARNCIGQKYANIQAKTTIIRIVSKFRIESITQLDEVTTLAFPVSHTDTPIKLRLSPRDSKDNNE